MKVKTNVKGGNFLLGEGLRAGGTSPLTECKPNQITIYCPPITVAPPFP